VKGELVAVATEEQSKPVAQKIAGSADDSAHGFAVPWQRRPLLMKVAGIGLVVGLLVAFLIPKQYQSTARLMPPDSNAVPGMSMLANVMGSLPAATAGLANNVLGFKSAGALTVGVLQSRTVQDNLINRFDLRKAYSYKTYQDARKKLASRSSISEDTRSGIVTITVTDTDPHRAQQLAESYVEELNDALTRLSTSSARRERIFLEQRLAKVKQDLDEATQRLSSFSSKNMTFDPQLQGKAMLDATATLQGQLIAAESELSGMEQIYGSENSRLKAARARVSELRSKLQAMSGRTGSASQSETSGNLSSNELYPSLEQLPLFGSTYVDLARRARIDETVFEALTKQYELAKVQEAKELPAIKVLDTADFPEKKSFPPRLIITLLSALVALLGAATWACVEEYLLGLQPDDRRRVFVQKSLKTLHLSGSPLTTGL
jgi:uncharacterized protein involved in exopolysaccharide biosynthesis